MDPSCLVTTVQAGGGGVMGCGMFSWHTLGPLVPIGHCLNATEKEKNGQGKIFSGLLMVLTFLITNRWSGNAQELHNTVDKVSWHRIAFFNLQTAFHRKRSQCCFTQG